MERLCAICYQSLSQITPKISSRWPKICDRMKIWSAKRHPKPKARTNDVSTFSSVAIWTMATDKQLIVTLSECVKYTPPKAICWHLAYVVVCRLTFSSVTNHIVILIENTVKRRCVNRIMFIGTSNEWQWDSWCRCVSLESTVEFKSTLNIFWIWCLCLLASTSYFCPQNNRGWINQYKGTLNFQLKRMYDKFYGNFSFEKTAPFIWRSNRI